MPIEPERFFERVAYEGLDKFGNTVQDPRPVDLAKLAGALKNYPLDKAIEVSLLSGVRKSEDFPVELN